MAGRLRTQLKTLTEISNAAHELWELVADAVPADACDLEISLRRIRGEPLDEKTALWNQLSDAADECQEASERLVELIEGRIRRLPTYRPPVLVPPPVTETTSARVEIPTDGPAATQGGWGAVIQVLRGAQG